MSDPIQAIQDRHGKATKGPWEVAPRSDTDEIANVAAQYEKVEGGARAIWIAELEADDAQGVEQMAADADFIAHAWEDIRTLLAEREALQAAVAFWEKRHETVEDILNARDRLAAELQAVKAQLDALQEREKALTAISPWRGGHNGWSATCIWCGGYERHPAMDQDYYGKAGHKENCAYLAAQPLPDETRKA